MRSTISEKSKRRILLILDLLSICISYGLAIYFRFLQTIAPWQTQLYRTILFFLLLVWILAYTFRHVRGRFYDLTEMDPLENLARVLRDRFLLYILLFVFLIGTKTSSQVSRKFLAYMILLDVAIDYTMRMIYRSILVHAAGKEEKQEDREERVLLITSRRDAVIALRRLQNGLGSRGRAAGIAFEDPESEEETEETSCSGSSFFSAKEGGETLHTGDGRPEETADRNQNDLLLTDQIQDCGSAEDALSPEHWREDGAYRRVFTRIYLYLPRAVPETIHRLLEQCAAIGMTADVCLTMDGTALPLAMIHRGAGEPGRGHGQEFCSYAAAEFTDMKKQCRVLNVDFAVSNVEAAASFILRNRERLRGQYVCFCNVHTTVMARENREYCRIQNHAAYTFADGAPIAQAQQSRGFAEAERCAGPDFMDAVFRATMDGRIGHYFYGSTPETLALLEPRLRERYPGIRICGMYSPPFRKLNEIPEEEDEADVRRINESGADLIWIGLGAPKQEQWMALHEGKLNGILFGVGAGFNFYAGNIRRAPKWIQKAGLEWLYRLCSDPKRLFSRYFVTNSKFLWYMFLDSFKR